MTFDITERSQRLTCILRTLLLNLNMRIHFHFGCCCCCCFLLRFMHSFIHSFVRSLRSRRCNLFQFSFKHFWLMRSRLRNTVVNYLCQFSFLLITKRLPFSSALWQMHSLNVHLTFLSKLTREHWYIFLHLIYKNETKLMQHIHASHVYYAMHFNEIECRGFLRTFRRIHSLPFP